MFLSDNQLYELILTGCSAKEELEWRARLRNSNQDTESDGSSDQMRAEYFNFLSLNIKPLGTVFRKPGAYSFVPFFFSLLWGRFVGLTKNRDHGQKDLRPSCHNHRSEISPLPGHSQEH